MRRKVFYAMRRAEGMTGIVEIDGFELEIGGEKFNAYEEAGRVYILDQRTGVSVKTYDLDDHEDILSGIRMAKEKLLQSGILEDLEDRRNTESYQITVKIYEAYKLAESLFKKQKEAVYREYKERKVEV